MKFMFFQYKISLLYGTIAIFYWKKINFILAVYFAATTLVIVLTWFLWRQRKTSASRYHPRYQSRSSMYIRGLIPRNLAELTEAVPIDLLLCQHGFCFVSVTLYNVSVTLSSA